MPKISSCPLGHYDERRTQHAVGQQIALLQYGDHGIGLLLRCDNADCLMAMRVELLAKRIDFG
jgi:hypothetical protein